MSDPTHLREALTEAKTVAAILRDDPATASLANRLDRAIHALSTTPAPPEERLAIFARHRPDSGEDGRCCRACGRPWPCDVQRLAALSAQP